MNRFEINDHKTRRHFSIASLENQTKKSFIKEIDGIVGHLSYSLHNLFTDNSNPHEFYKSGDYSQFPMFEF